MPLTLGSGRPLHSVVGGTRATLARFICAAVAALFSSCVAAPLHDATCVYDPTFTEAPPDMAAGRQEATSVWWGRWEQGTWASMLQAGIVLAAAAAAVAAAVWWSNHGTNSSAAAAEGGGL